MSRVSSAGGFEPAEPALHAPDRYERDASSSDSEPRPPGKVVWLAIGWDMARDQIVRLDPGAVDLGAMRAARWRLVSADGRLVATPAEAGSVWGHAWRLDRQAAERLAARRHSQGVREYIRAVDRWGQECDVELLAAPKEARTGGRTSMLDMGWAIRGACEGGLPWSARCTLARALVRAPRSG